MSYNRQRKDKDYEQKITITKTTITKNSQKETDDNYNNEDLDDVIKAFEYFDINHNGRMSISELKRVLSFFGDKMNEDEIINIFRSAGIDYNSDDDIDYMRFIDFWAPISAPP